MNGKLFLTQAEVTKIHEETLRIMESIGIQVMEKQARDDFSSAGCRVDEERERVFFSRAVVEKALSTVPASFEFYDINGENPITLGGDKPLYLTGSFASFHLDYKTGEYLPTDYEQLSSLLQVAESLDFPDIVMTSTQPQNEPPAYQDLYMAKAALENTKKPFGLVGYSEKNAQAIIDMVAACMGGHDILRKKPHFLFNVCTLSPLRMRDDGCEVIRACAKNNVPCWMSSGPMAGATAPVTLAGTLCVAWAEALAHTILAQIYAPGAPVVVGAYSRIFDMKYGTCTVGSPEYGLMRIAFTQLCQNVNVPSGAGGCLADSNDIDCQYGWEKFMTAFMPRYAGQSIIHGIGMLTQLNAFSLESMVIDREIIRTANRMLDGIIVDDEHIAYDVIDANKDKCDYLNSNHTFKHYRKEHFLPELTDRRLLQGWQNSDESAKDIRARAKIIIEKAFARYSYDGKKKYSEKLDVIIKEFISSRK